MIQHRIRTPTTKNSMESEKFLTALHEDPSRKHQKPESPANRAEIRGESRIDSARSNQNRANFRYDSDRILKENTDPEKKVSRPEICANPVDKLV